MFRKYQVSEKNYGAKENSLSSPIENSAIKIGNNKSKKCPMGQRHVVAMLAFLTFCLLNGHRLALGVAIVAMVNRTKTIETHSSNKSEISCPLPPTISILNETLSEGEFDWDSELQGYILSAGFFGYTFTLLIGGRLAEIWGAKKTILTGNLLAGVFTLISPFASRWNIYALIAVQFARGLAQGIMFASLYLLMANWFPISERSILSTFVLCGLPFGAATAAAISGWMCDVPKLAWPATFYFFGIVNIIVSVMFAFLVYEIPQDHPRITTEELKFITENQETDVSKKRPPIPWRRILTSVPVYALFCGVFGQFWSMSYFLSVHPTFMGTILHYSMTQNGVVSSLPIILKTLGGFLASLSSNWLSNYVNVDKLRKGYNSFGSFGFCASMIGVVMAGCNSLVDNICFTLSLFCSGISIAGALIVSVDMSPRYAGTVTGFASTIASLANVIVPIMVGALTKNENLAEWHRVFYISIAVVFVSGVVFIVFGSAEVQPWNYTDDDVAADNAKEFQDKIPKVFSIESDKV